MWELNASGWGSFTVKVTALAAAFVCGGLKIMLCAQLTIKWASGTYYPSTETEHSWELVFFNGSGVDFAEICHEVEYNCLL